MLQCGNTTKQDPVFSRVLASCIFLVWRNPPHIKLSAPPMISAKRFLVSHGEGLMCAGVPTEHEFTLKLTKANENSLQAINLRWFKRILRL